MLTPQQIDPHDKKKRKKKKKDGPYYAFSAFQLSPDPNCIPKPKCAS